jgi:hypothetical protein
MRRLSLIFLLCLVGLLPLRAQYRDDQFKRDAFSQTYADTTDKQVKADSSVIFSFKEFFGGLAHKRTSSLQSLTIGSAVFIGGNQIYHKQYWKLPIIYGGIGAGIYGGIRFNQLYQASGDTKYQTYSTLSYVGAGLMWWGSLMDGVVSFKGTRQPDPMKAMFFSLLLPGLGQIYNGEFWKVPIYWGLMAGCAHFWIENNMQYRRWKWVYDQANSDDPTVEKPPQSAETAKYYRDTYRRYRDYSVLFTAIAYVLQIIDANVFAYMQDFEVNDQLTLKVTPSAVPMEYAASPAVGMTIGLKF